MTNQHMKVARFPNSIAFQVNGLATFETPVISFPVSVCRLGGTKFGWSLLLAPRIGALV